MLVTQQPRTIADYGGRLGEKLVDEALMYLRDKFRSVRSFGPRQVVAFHNPGIAEEGDMQARRAYELVGRLLELIRGDER